jgi:hypothetical protein
MLHPARAEGLGAAAGTTRRQPPATWPRTGRHFHVEGRAALAAADAQQARRAA